MKIRDKLILGYLLVASFSGITAYFTIQSYLNISSAFKTMAEDPLPAIKALEGVKHGGARVISTTAEFGFIRDEAALADRETLENEEVEHLAAARRLYEQSLNSYEAVATKPPHDEPENFAKIKSVGDALLKTSGEIIEMKKAGIAGKDVLAKKEEFERRESAFLQSVEQALENEYGELAQEQAQVESAIAASVQKTLLVKILVFALALAAGIYISRILGRRIIELKEASEKVSRGELDARIEIETSDEIGDLARSFNKMVADLKESRAEMLSAKNYVDNIINSMADVLVVTDLDGIVRRVNEATVALTGYAEDELVNYPATNLGVQGDVLSPSHLAELEAKGFLNSIEKKILTKDGRLIPISLSVSLMRDTHGKAFGFVCVAQDIIERKEVEKALRDSEEQHRLLFETNPHPAYVFDLETLKFLAVNDAAVRNYGYSREEFLNDLTLKDIRPSEDVPHLLERISQVAHEGDIIMAPWRHQRRDGTILDVEITTHVLTFAGRPAEIVLVNDVTERRKAEEQLIIFNQKLQQSNRELQDFAYIASHDLQEPLRKVQAFGDRLAAKYSDALSGDGLDYLERMRAAANRMQTLIQDLLKFSRVTTKAQPFAPVNLMQVTCEVLSDLEVRIEESGAQIEIGELPTLEADPLQMRQLMQNLVGNSLKFRRQDAAPLIKIYSETSETVIHDTISNGERCQIIVEDNGIGFDEKYASRIFTVFQRLNGRTDYEGSGIGLAVCRKIAERHCGNITARSAPGEGAAFIVTLPLKQTKVEMN